MKTKKVIVGITIALFTTALVIGGYLYVRHSSKKSATVTESQQNIILNTNQVAQLQSVHGDIVADFGNSSGAPLLKSKFGVSNNIASVGLLESLEATYLDDLGSGLFCTQVEFDQELKHGSDSSLITPNPALVTTVDSDGKTILVGKPSAWLQKFETSINDKNIPLLIQLGGAPAPYQVTKISKPAEHPAPTDGPNFLQSSKVIGEWTDATNHTSPILWSVWHEPEHALVGIDRSKNIAGDYIPPYTKDNPEPKDVFEARDNQSRSDAIAILDTLYRAYYSSMQPTLLPYSAVGLAGFLSSGFNPLKLTTKTNTHPEETFFKAFIDNYTAINPQKPTPVQFLSFDSYNGLWQEVVQGTRKALLNRTDFGPLIFNEYAPSNMKLSDDGQSGTASNLGASVIQSTLTDKKATKIDSKKSKRASTTSADSTKNANPTTIDAALQMLNDMVGIIEQPDIAHLCMSYWTGGSDGILSRDKNTSTVTPTVRYTALRFYSELPVAQVLLSGKEIVPVSTKGLHGLAGVDYQRAGVLLWNDGNSDITTTVQLSNLPKSITNGTISGTVESIESDSDTKPVATAFTGQSITIKTHSITLITVKNTAIDSPLERRNSLATGASKPQFLTAMPMINRTETTCSNDLCTLPALHYGSYDSVRSIAYLGTIAANTNAKTSVSYKNLPNTLYLNTYTYGSPLTSEQLSVEVSFEGCSQKITTPIRAMGITTAIDFATTGTACNWTNHNKTATISFSMDGGTKATQAEVYLSGNQNNADAIAKALQ